MQLAALFVVWECTVEHPSGIVIMEVNVLTQTLASGAEYLP